MIAKFVLITVLALLPANKVRHVKLKTFLHVGVRRVDSVYTAYPEGIRKSEALLSHDVYLSVLGAIGRDTCLLTVFYMCYMFYLPRFIVLSSGSHCRCPPVPKVLAKYAN